MFKRCLAVFLAMTVFFATVNVSGYAVCAEEEKGTEVIESVTEEFNSEEVTSTEIVEVEDMIEEVTSLEEEIVDVESFSEEETESNRDIEADNMDLLSGYVNDGSNDFSLLSELAVKEKNVIEKLLLTYVDVFNDFNRADIEKNSYIALDAVEDIANKFDDYNSGVEAFGLKITDYKSNLTVSDIIVDDNSITVVLDEVINTKCTDNIEDYEYEKLYELEINIDVIQKIIKNIDYETTKGEFFESTAGQMLDSQNTINVVTSPPAIKALPTLTGNKRQDAANIARSQIGYKEGTNNYNAYAPAIGTSNNLAWCAIFATWCAYTSGIDKANWPSSGYFRSTTASVKWFQDYGRWHNKVTYKWKYNGADTDGSVDGYAAQAGDFAAVENDGGWGGSPDHTAIVVGNDGTYVYTVEGNVGAGVVKEYKYYASTLKRVDYPEIYIVGFGEPDYGGGTAPTGYSLSVSKSVIYDSDQFSLTVKPHQNDISKYVLIIEQPGGTSRMDVTQSVKANNGTVAFVLTGASPGTYKFGFEISNPYGTFTGTSANGGMVGLQKKNVSWGSVVNLGSGFTAAIQNMTSATMVTNNGNTVGYNYNDKNTQWWKFIRQTDGSYKIQSLSDSKYLEVENGTQYAGAKIKVGSAVNENKQKWFIYTNGNGYNLRSAVSQSAVLDLDNASTANNSALHIMTYSNHGAQRFNIIKRNELKSVSFDKSEINLKQGGKSTLNIVWNPSGSTDLMYYAWSSSDTNVATISSSNGTATIAAKGAGTSTITCKVTTVNGKVRTAACKVNVTSTLTGISLNKTSSTMYVGDTFGLNIYFTPAEAKSSELKNLKLTSSNTSVAVVNDEWMVSAVGTGKATITATVGKYTAKCEITVKEKPIYVTGIQLDKNSLSLKVGDVTYLNAIYLPQNANTNIPADTDYEWISRDTSIVTVENGKVTAKGVGKTMIVAAYQDFLYNCKVTVAKKTSQLKGVSLEHSEMEIAVDYFEKLVPKYSPSNVVPNELKWSSSDSEILTINAQTGLMKAVSTGTAVVTIEADGYKASCDVKVVLPVDEYLLSYTDNNGNDIKSVDALEMLSKESIQLSVNYLPEKATANLPKNVSWTSSDSKIATVVDGKVTALAVGEATIYADVVTTGKWEIDLEKRIACQIKVKPSEDSIQVGDNVYAEIEGDTLYIRGSGDMYDFTSDNLPAYCSNTDITKIVFDEGITRIGKFCFFSMQGLAEVKFCDSVKSIGDGAFGRCDKIKTLILPGELVTIEQRAFYGSKIENIIFNNNLEFIGYYAFKDNSLKEIILPNSVNEVDYYAFDGATQLKKFVSSDSQTEFTFPLTPNGTMNLQTLYIGENIKQMNRYNGIFEACGRDGGIDTMIPYYPFIYEMTVNAENKTYTYRDGMLLKDNGKTVFYIVYNDNWENGTIVIPEGIEKVECQIPGKHVILPSTLKELPDLFHKPAMFPYAESIEISAENKYYTTVNGVLFSKDMSVLVAYPYRRSEKKYIVPDGVTTINNDAGIESPYLSSIVLNNQIIGEKTTFTKITEEGEVINYSGNIFRLEQMSGKVFVIPQKVEYLSDKTDSVVILTGNAIKKLYLDSNVTIVVNGNVEIVKEASTNEINVVSLDEYIKDIIISEEQYSLSLGENIVIEANIEVNEALIPSICGKDIPNAIWTSDNPSVATVNNGGEVKAVGVGVATLTASLGDVSKEVKVYVGQAEEKATLMEDLHVASVPDQTYTGSKVAPVISVYDGNTLLILNKDYTVSYKNNINVWNGEGTKKPTVIVKGKGNYQGTEEVAFNIVKKSLLDDDITVSDLQAVKPTGKRQKLKPIVYRNGKKLKLGKDYSLEWPDTAIGAYIVPGIYSVIIKGINGYEGEIEKTITISKVDQVLISKVTVSKVKNQSYTGGEIKPGLVLAYKGKTLVEGTDYKVSYRNNVNVGKATVHVEGIGEFAGTRDVKFNITGLSIGKANVSYTKTHIYTGTEIDPSIVVTLNGQVLEKGTDYNVSYKKNVNKGSATILVTGINQYTGSVSKKFTIASVDMETASKEGTMFVEEDISTEYVKGGCTPDVNITYNGIKLVKGKDYTLTYKNNKAVADENSEKIPQIIVHGKGNYKGSIAKTFSIVSRDMEAGVKVAVKDVIFSTKSKAFLVNPVLTDLNGKKLKKGKDYESNLEYTYAEPTLLIDGTSKEEKDIVQKGDIPIVGSKIAVKITGKGNYSGSVYAYYSVAETSISKATIKVNAQIYTGKAIVLDEQKDFKTATYGKGINKIQLTLGDDFEIVPGSYKKNVSKGTATVTVRGLGNYGGTKQLSFKIKGKFLFW